ncbi:MAG: hypothetical protein ACO3MW_09040 [Rhodospirillales bacterium]
MAKEKEPIYIDVLGDRITIFPHHYLAKQGIIAMEVCLLALAIFHEYMIANFSLKWLIFFALFCVLIILSALASMRNKLPMMIMDNEKLSFPREQFKPVKWNDLQRIDYKHNHMVLYPKAGEPIRIWVDHRWPLPCFIIRDMMIKKRRDADIRVPPDHEFFVSD